MKVKNKYKTCTLFENSLERQIKDMKIRKAKQKTKNNKSFSSSIFIKLICGAIWPDREHVHPTCCSHFISRTMFHGTGGVLKKSMPRNSLNPCLLRRTAWQFRRSSSTSPFLILRMSCVTKTIAMKAMWATESRMESLTKKKMWRGGRCGATQQMEKCSFQV